MFDEYQARPHKIEAVQMTTPPKRLNMLSSVYEYEGTEFVSPSMPVQGDYLVRVLGNVIVKKQKEFDGYYTKVEQANG